jgi:diaminohydroxyphosphoribosylaminopyrimidine deaminase/5-amino-6-(5-phosphoribosylamino)uracil reductase
MKNVSEDAQWMDEALRLARKGMGWTNPNPMVGAVIVKNGRVIARGFHHRAGGAHAEIEALRSAKADVRGATLYVNLEPCSHEGRTPPCVGAIIRAGIKRVVCSTRDRNPLVRGRGIAQLRRAGVEVVVSVRAAEARALNEAFFTFHEQGRPFVALKFAASLDGKLATRTGDSKWITNERAREAASGLRGRYQAVAVGVGTILRDDPHLGVRDGKKKDPLRIVLDPDLRIPPRARVLRDGNVLVVARSGASRSKKMQLEKRGASVVLLKGKTISFSDLFSELRKREIISVLVEGGGETIGRFLDYGVADRVYAFYAPIVVGGRDAVGIAGTGAATIADAMRLKDISMRRFGDNVLLSGLFLHRKRL